LKQEEAGTDSQIESTSSPIRPSKRAKAKRHCRRWWWVWLIAWLIADLVIIIIVIYGIIPPVAQSRLNKTVLHTNSLEILDPTPNSFLASLNATITGGDGIADGAKLDGFDVDFFLQGDDRKNVFMTLPVPTLTSHKSTPLNLANHTVIIGNSSAFAGFSDALLHNESLQVALTGKTTVHLGGIHTGVNYNEVVTLKGLNNLAGMKITNFSLSKDQDANLVGKVLIPNPSVFTIQMGNVNLDISLKAKHVGTGVIPNLLLTPGNNLYDFRSLIDESQLLNIAVAVASTPLIITSNGTTVGGQNITWLSEPLTKLNSSVPVQSS